MSFAKQITEYRSLKRIKVIGHPAREGFEQHYDFGGSLYAGYISSVNNWGINYRAYPSTMTTGRLFDTLEEALDYLEHN